MKGYLKVARTKDLLTRSTLAIPGEGLDRVEVCIVRVGGEYHAISNVCTHKGGPMNEGRLTGSHLVCPWHKAHFRLRDGANFFPAQRELRVFKVKVKDESLYIKIPKKLSVLK